MKDNDIINPFEDIFNAVVSQNVKQCISWTSLIHWL